MRDALPGSSSGGLADRLGAARVYAILAGISLLMLVVIVPPFQVPDEPQHFFRAYQLSTFELWTRRQGERNGTDLPASLPALVERFMGTNALHAVRYITPQPLVGTLAELTRPLNPERTAFVVFDTGAYAPPAYLPQALGVAAGRMLNVGPLGLFFLARLANALAAWALICTALHVFGVGARFALVVALLPMSQFLMASCSPDALTIASAFVFTAVVTRFLTDRRWTRFRGLAAFVSGAVMCSIKFVLAPLLFCGLAALFSPGAWRDRGVRHAAMWQLASALLAVALVGMWLWSVGDFSGSQPQADVDATAQAVYVVRHPLDFLGIVLRSIGFKRDFLWDSLVGKFGWLNVPLPGWAYWIAGLAFALGIYGESEKSRFPGTAIAWFALLVTCSVMLTYFTLYVMWTIVAGQIVEGVQGRYLIPLLPAVGCSLVSLLPSERVLPQADRAYILLLAMLIAATFVMHWAIVVRYGVV